MKMVLTVAKEDDVASTIVQQISNYSICKLVIGSSDHNIIVRRFKSIDVPAAVAKNAPNFLFCICNIKSKAYFSPLSFIYRIQDEALIIVVAFVLERL